MSDKLSAYHAKRNFKLTPEPHGGAAAKGERLRFVVQKHAARRLHYDFRLELDGSLKSWAVPKGPSLDPAEKRLAVHVEDHPLDYIDFEGDIPPRQYGAGHVEVWDTGYWEAQGDALADYKKGKLKFTLDGEKLQGGWTLVRTRLQASSDKEQWLLIKERDAQARPSAEFDITRALPHSVLSGEGAGTKTRGRNKTASTGTVTTEVPEKNIKNHKSGGKAKSKTAADAPQAGDPSPQALPKAVPSPLPERMSPQLATLVDAAPSRGDWLYEIKFDGYRFMARVEHGKAHLFTRDGHDWTKRLPQQARAIEALGLENAWLDGEMVVLDEQGAPSFQLLQNAFDQASGKPIVYFLFDLPYLNGYDLRKTPLRARRAALDQVLAGHESDVLRYSAQLEQPVQQLLDSACEMSLEGLIGKRADSAYVNARSSNWIKLKCTRRQEMVIAGYTEPQGARRFFGALVLGVYGEDGKLRYAGRVGTGFDEKLLASLFQKMRELEQDACPFAAQPPGVRNRVHWLRPKLVAEVSFSEWTQEGALRHPVFEGLRADKPAAEVRREEASSLSRQRNAHAVGKNARRSKAHDRKAADELEGIKISNAERVIDTASGATKFDLAHYYQQVAPLMLPYLENRPVYLLRAPEGVAGEQFFQKHNTRMRIPGVRTLEAELLPGHDPLMLIDSPEGLVGAAQMGTIELHVPNATADRIDRPDCMVFDLDPDPDLSWAATTEAARFTRVVLDELGLCSFLKTSGGKGLHLVVPLTRRHDWDSVNAFSQAVAQHMARTLPDRFSAKMGAKNRVGKIFIDYLRNGRSASTIAPYAVRARRALPVSVPIAWDELPEVGSAAHWTIAGLPELLARARNDPWAEYFDSRQTLTAAMKKKIGMK